jgi:hypothetical protein
MPRVEPIRSPGQRCLWLLSLSLLWGCPPPAEAPWRVASEEPSAWLLSVAVGSGEVLAAGGQPGPSSQQPGTGQLLIARDGQARRLGSPIPGMLWWVHALPSGVAYLAGEGGAVLRYDPQKPQDLVQVRTDTTATLYGIWAFSDDDIWAVGGNDGQPGVVLHGGLGGLVSERGLPTVSVLYKIWAADPERLFVVGAVGVLLRRSGGTWVRDASPTNDRLLTVWGDGPGEVYAVGGLSEGRALRYDGTSWSLLPGSGPAGPLEALNGVTLVGDEVLAVGQRGLVARRRRGDLTGPWQIAEPATSLDLHAAAGLGDSWFAAGGNLSQFRIMPPRGVLLQRGGTLLFAPVSTPRPAR